MENTQIQLVRQSLKRDKPVCCTEASQQHSGLHHREREDFKARLFLLKLAAQPNRSTGRKVLRRRREPLLALVCWRRSFRDPMCRSESSERSNIDMQSALWLSLSGPTRALTWIQSIILEPLMLSIQPDRSSEDVQRRMAEYPQVLVLKDWRLEVAQLYITLSVCGSNAQGCSG